MSDLVNRLRRQLTMSMFATKDDLYGQLHDERGKAADRLYQLERVLAQARDGFRTIQWQSAGANDSEIWLAMGAIESRSRVAIASIDEVLK